MCIGGKTHGFLIEEKLERAYFKGHKGKGHISNRISIWYLSEVLISSGKYPTSSSTLVAWQSIWTWQSTTFGGEISFLEINGNYSPVFWWNPFDGAFPTP